jgi:hypothetical protein
MSGRTDASGHVHVHADVLTGDPGSPVWRPILTRTEIPSGHACAASLC